MRLRSRTGTETKVTNSAKDPNASGAKRRASTSVPSRLTAWANPLPVIKVRTCEMNLPDDLGKRESRCGPWVLTSGWVIVVLDTGVGNSDFHSDDGGKHS